MHQVVGRDEERKELRRAYELAQKGHGSLVCVSGDVGLGKTSLVDAFLNDLIDAGQSFHLARARCSEPLTDGEPLMPWIEALSGLAQEETVCGLMERSAPGWYREISHTGSGQVRRMKRELLDFFRTISPVHPLIVVLDDFHWSEVASVDLVAYLASRLESTRVLVVVCYRLVEMKVNKHPFAQVRLDLLGQNACTELNLGLLSKDQVEQHLSVAYREHSFQSDYAGFLHAKTQGNPLFIREMIRTTGELAESIRNMILRKLDRVSDSARDLLIAASVQGREFDSAVLARSLGMKPEDVEEHLRTLDEVHGLIQRLREEELPDGKFTVRYRFMYTFYQEVCYSTLAPTRKATLNASLAEAFLTYYGH
ncbi:MAG: AAA family ATPase [Acidobacteria bacterium]|nr:AAA family ATPase [Acidobacteriota bacterium]